MAAKADGTIYINTAIETDGFKAGGKDIETAARRMAKTVSGIGTSARIAMQKQVDAFAKMNQQYAQQEQKIESLKNKLRELDNLKIETEEYKALGKELKNLEDEFDKVEAEQREWINMGFPLDSSGIEKLDRELDRIYASMEKVQAKQKQMKMSGTAYVNQSGTAVYQGTESRLAAEEQKLQQMNNKLGTSYEALKAKVNGYSKEAAKLSNVKKRLTKNTNGMVSALKRGAAAMMGLNRKSKSTRMSLGRMLGMSILFSTAFRAISAVTKGIGEGIKNLAQYSDSTNASLSSMMSALTQLKNSFATAFAPILTAVAPLLTSFINMMSRAVTYVGMFIAALTGQKTFIKATGVQQDYAASLENSADAAKDAKKANTDYLSGLDEVARFTTDKDAGGTGGGGGGGLSPEDMFETVPIESSIAGMIDKIKALISNEDWEGLGAYIASGVNAGMQKIYDVINWDNVGPKITYFVNAFTGTLNSLVDHIDWDLMGRTIGAGINTVVNTLNLLIEGIDWVNIGKSFATGVMGLVHEVNWTNLGHAIGNKFMIAWKVFYGFVTNLNYEEIGKAIADALNGTIERIDLGMIFSALSQLAIGILDALITAIQNTNWEEVGQQIADALLAIDWIGLASKLFQAGIELVGGLLKAFGELPGPVQAVISLFAGFMAASKIASIVTFITSKVIPLLSGGGGLIGILTRIFPALGAIISALGGPMTLAIVAAIGAGILLISHWDDVKAAAGKLADWIVDKFEKLKKGAVEKFEQFKKDTQEKLQQMQERFSKFDSFLQGVFEKDWTKSFGALGEVLNGFFKNLSNIWDSIKTIFQGIITFIDGVFAGDWRKAWEGIKQIVSGIWNGIVAVIKSPINGIIGAINYMLRSITAGINAVIKTLNRFNITIPSWVPGFGGKRFGFNLSTISTPSIPYLATGAVIPPNKEFMAVLGDQKHGMNIEAPENLLRKIVREESGTRSGGKYCFTAQINRRTLFEELIEEAKLHQMQSGQNPFELT